MKEVRPPPLQPKIHFALAGIFFFGSAAILAVCYYIVFHCNVPSWLNHTAWLVGFAALYLGFEGTFTAILEGLGDLRELRENTPRGICPKCKYDLRGNVDPARCPECGSDIPKELQVSPINSEKD